MADYLGDFLAGVTLDHKFCTVTTTGAPTTLAGTPAISVYKDNSTTQSTSGVTLSVDFDSVTGLNNVRIDLSSDGSFYAAGSNFQVVITTGTVGGTSVVGYVVASFSILNRSVALDASGRVNVIKLASQTVTAAAGVTFPASVASPTNITAATGIDVTKWNGTTVSTPATAGIPEVNVKNINNVATTPVTTVKAVQGLTTADVVASVTGAVGSVTGAVGSVTGNVGGSVASVTGAVGSVTGNVGGSVAHVTAVDSAAITNASFAAGAIDAAAIAANAIGSSEFAASAQNATADSLLNRNLATGGSGNTRNVQNALRGLRNKVEIDTLGGLNVYQEDDTTLAWQGSSTRTPGADPLTVVTGS